MLESLQDLFLQKQKAETVCFDRKPEKKPDDDVLFKKPKSIRRLSKKDISSPCNFKHVSGLLCTTQCTQFVGFHSSEVCPLQYAICNSIPSPPSLLPSPPSLSSSLLHPSSPPLLSSSPLLLPSPLPTGITMQRTQSCEEELRGTIQRKMRSLSLSSLTRSKPRPPLYGTPLTCHTCTQAQTLTHVRCLKSLDMYINPFRSHALWLQVKCDWLYACLMCATWILLVQN